MQNTIGIHHITAIAGDPQENLDFYVGVLGMRLVKRSVNQDVPDTYHLFFADGEGHPGTDLTFFPWPALPPVRRGAGQWDEVALGVPPGSLDFWQPRLSSAGVRCGAVETRFGERVLPFEDPHGMRLALIEAPEYAAFEFAPWDEGPVPVEHQIRTLAGVRLVERDDSATVRFLSEGLGFRRGETEDGWTRYIVGDGAAGQRVDLRIEAQAPRGQWGVGAVHHVAWRATDSDQQRMAQQAIAGVGGRPTAVIDRFWFKSIYVTEPGGALFEVATDGPGFSVDEDPAHLGEALVLPSWLEPARADIEAQLPVLRVPTPARPGSV